MTGKLELLIGPMYSGKSSALIRELVIASEIGLKVLYINHTWDTRSEHIFSTHHPFLTPKGFDGIDFISKSDLKGVRKEEYDVIGIDEAQFFDKELYNFCKIHVETYQRHVIVAGLDSNFKREKFGYVLDLIPIADKVEKLKPFCHDCGPKRVEALFSHKFEGSSTEVEVGGKDKYVPLCRDCYLRLN